MRERESVSHWSGLISEIKKFGIYNCVTTTLMPTGTVSILAGQGESNGIEPLFALTTARKFMNKECKLEEFTVFCPVVQDWKDKHPGEKLPDYIVTKDNLLPEDHIRVLAAAQKHCQTGVSKTVNLKHKASRKSICDAMLLAYNSGCKSVSIYRDGSRSVQILTSGTEVEEILVPQKYHSKEIPGKSVLFSVKRQRSGKIKGILPKDESGSLITVGNEAAKCNLINKLIDCDVPIEGILQELAKTSEGNGDLSTALHNILKDASRDEDETLQKQAKALEATPEFQSCPTGACSL